MKEVIALLKENYRKKIDKIEVLAGEGDKNKGNEIIAGLLKNLVQEKFLSEEIGKIINRRRHTIHRWYKRYHINSNYYEGIKKSIIVLTKSKEKHNTQNARYEKIGDSYYRTYYVYPTAEFCYLIGLILGDGSCDKTKIYLVGGKPFEFLDKIHSIINKVCEYLGNRSTKVLYFTKEDRQTERNDPEVSYWRIYIYWSALSNLFRNKEMLKNSLGIIWSNKELFNSFSAGLFDTDGYFTEKYGKPERIEVEQTNKKWWFPLFCEEFKKRYVTTEGKRERKYKIIKKGIVYEGISESSRIGLRKSSWPEFIDSVIKPYSNKIWYKEKCDFFKQYALANKNRWHIWRK